MKGVININGDIGSFDWDGDEVKGVSLTDVIAQVKKQKDATSFDVFINSKGGSVKVGMDIYNYLKSLPQPITTIGQGVVASIATVIFMAGDVRKIEKNVAFMIHLPSGMVHGTSEEIAAYSKLVEKVEGEMIELYMKGLDLDKDTVKALLEDETWLNEEQLTALGVITEQPENIIAKLYIGEELKINSKKRKMSTNKKSLIDQIKALINGNVTAKIVFDANNAEINFFELAEDAVPVEGDMATVDGEPAEGSYTMTDGSVYNFEAGALVSITMPEEEVTVEELQTELEETMAKLSQTQAELATIKASLSVTKKTLQEKETILAKIASMKAEDFEEEEARRKPNRRSADPAPKKSRVGSAIARIRK